MKRLLALLLSIGVGASQARATDIIQAGITGSVSQCIDLFILDDTATDGSGLTGLTSATAGTCSYRRDNAAAPVNLTLVAGTVGTFTSSGFVEVDPTDQPGVYQLCLPNAAVATGVKSVTAMCKGAASAAPVTKLVLLSPSVTVDVMNASVNVASVDTGAIQEIDFAPTNLFGTGSTTSALQLAAGETSNDISGQSICVTSGAASKTCRPIVTPGGYNTTTKVATVSPAFTNAPANGDGYSIGNYVSSGGGGSCPTAADIWAYATRTLSAGAISLTSFASDVMVFPVKTAQSATTAQVVLANSETFGDNTLNNNNSVYIFSSTSGIKQNSCIKTYTASSKVATLVTPFKMAPSGTVKYVVLPTPNCNLSLYPSGH